jgi:uncharacterized protein (DUF1778 family)
MADPNPERPKEPIASRDNEAAAVADHTLREFLIADRQERAARLPADRSRFVLSDERWTAFMRTLDRPARVNSKIVSLLSRPRPQ